MSPVHAWAAKRRNSADFWFGLTAVLAGAPLIAVIIIGWIGGA